MKSSLVQAGKMSGEAWEREREGALGELNEATCVFKATSSSQSRKARTDMVASVHLSSTSHSRQGSRPRQWGRTRLKCHFEGNAIDRQLNIQTLVNVFAQHTRKIFGIVREYNNMNRNKGVEAISIIYTTLFWIRNLSVRPPDHGNADTLAASTLRNADNSIYNMWCNLRVQWGRPCLISIQFQLHYCLPFSWSERTPSTSLGLGFLGGSSDDQDRPEKHTAQNETRFIRLLT